MKNILSCFTLLFGFVVAMQAQPIGTSSYESKLQLAAEALANKDYYNALTQYELAYEEREDPTLIPMIAEANFYLRDYAGAERWYRRILRRDPENQFIEQRFNMAQSLKMMGRYDDAVQEFQQYLANGKDPEKLRQAQIEITGAELASSLSGAIQGVTVGALPKEINTPLSQYSPALSTGGGILYFASLEGKEVIIVEDENKPENFARIFSASIKDGEKDEEEGVQFEKPVVLGPEINRPGYHSVNPSLSPDGRRMFFNRVKLTGNVPSEAKIYLSEGGDGAWKSANEVNGVNGDYLALHPVVGELFGKEVLFFSSNMDGGQGGLDLFYATHQGDGVYGDPVNLGPNINTTGNETTPFWFDGTLYFSSDGYPGLGGEDIFYSVWNGTEWSSPLNMGPSFNTPADERYFKLFDEGYQGFFTSNREGGARSPIGKTCCDDIYAFAIARKFVALVAGTFSEDKQPLKGATLQLIDGTPGVSDAPTSLTRSEGNRFDFSLNFDRSYTVIATHPDYFPDTVTFNTNGVTDSKTFEQRLFLKPRPKEPEFIEVVIDQPIVLENILYDFDDDRITPASEEDLRVLLELMNEYPDMVIELSSHTDARGNDEYNRELSQRRAESARRWLMREGVGRERIQAKGYGETVPQTVSAKVAGANAFLKEGDILTEAFINALPEEAQRETAHQYNRRTEFKIIAGPTSIKIKSTRLKKQDETDRGSNIMGQNTPAPEPKPQAPIIDKMSSLYGQGNIAGLPIMQFGQRKINLGLVPRGEKRSFDYTFTNKGTGDLVIDIISACDCTSTNMEDIAGKVFHPGESGTIKVTFDSTEKEESETIDIDIFLRNTDNEGNIILETIQYAFELKQ